MPIKNKKKKPYPPLKGNYSDSRDSSATGEADEVLTADITGKQ